MAEVRLQAVSKRFGEVEAVRGIDLTIADGEFVVLLGPTGAGKTTTLRLIAGLERPDHGRVHIANRDVTGEAPTGRDVSFVFQQYSLYPHLSVRDNLAFPLKSPARKMDKGAIAARVQEIARLVRIDHKLDNRATRLSGGEMQRVAIGRALVREPAIYLMDEPLSSLDAKLRSDLRLELKRIQEEIGATILYVTHDQLEAMTMADRIGIMENGRLLQIGTPREIYEDPASVHVAMRLGQPGINLLPASSLPGVAVPSSASIMGARTEHLAIRPSDQGNAHVDRIEHLGDQVRLHCHLDTGHPLVTLAERDIAFEPRQPVRIEAHDALWFDRDGARVRA